MKTGWNRPVVIALAIVAVLGVACSETTKEVFDPPVIVDTDDTLPDGFVTENRPDNPPTTFQVACPWGEVFDSRNNPYLAAGGQPDQIQSIDNPVFIPVSSADYMLNSEKVISCEIDGIVRAFPVRILVFHEIVNMCWDTSDGPVFSFLSYCPLVDVGIHFVHPHECNKPRRNSFGVSGLLFNGNLVFYDRKTLPISGSGSPDMFVQMLAGGLGETCTTVEPVFATMSWGMFERLYPEGFILSDDTGVVPLEGYDFFDNPYQDYWRQGNLWFPNSFDDKRIGNWMTDVYGVIGPKKRKAYITGGTDYVKNDKLDGRNIVVWNDNHLGSTLAFQSVAGGQNLTFSFLGRESKGLPVYRDDETGSVWTFDGIAVEGPLSGERLPRVIGYRAFWFAWAAMFPETWLYNPNG